MIPRVDAHTHLGLQRFVVHPISEEKRRRPAFRDRLENTLSQLLAALDANGIDRAVAFPYPLEEADPVAANEYVLEAHRAYPGRIIPFALVGDDVDRWLHRGVAGFKQHDILQAPERFDLGRAYRAMAEAGAPLLVHCRTAGGPPVAERVHAILREAPGLRLILAHMGRRTPNTAEGVEENLAALRDAGDVYFETSTVRDPAAIVQAVKVLGADRVLFGSDYPFNSYLDADPLAEELSVIERAGLPEEITVRLLGQNILDCLNL